MMTSPLESFESGFFKSTKLFNYFESVKRHHLSAIVAPTGYGKTSAVRKFVKENNLDYIWISLNEHDDVPKYFWDKLSNYFISENNLPFLYTCGFPDDNHKLSAFFKFMRNQCEKITDKYIILDNFNNIQNEKIYDFIIRFTYEQFDNFHLILITEKALPQSIMELYLANLLYIINTRAFELSENEIKSYFAKNELFITNEQAYEVSDYTDGWIILVNLIMILYKDTKRLELPDEIDSLIEKTTLSHFTDDEIAILTKLSVFNEFDINVACAAIPDCCTPEKIAKISSKTHLLQYNSDTKKYKVSSIVKNMFRKKFLSKSYNEVNSIHKRAGHYLIENARPVEGVNELYLAGARKSILSFFKNFPYMRWQEFSTSDLVKYLYDATREEKTKYFLTFLRLSIYLSVNGRKQFSQNLMEELLEIYNTSWLLTADKQNQLLGEINLALYYANISSPSIALKFLKLADEYLINGSVIINKKIDFVMTCVALLSPLYEKVGELKLALKNGLEMANILFRLSGGIYAGGLKEYLTAEYLFLTGEFETAIKYLYDAMEKSQKYLQTSITLRSAYLIMRIMIINGNTLGIERMAKIQCDVVSKANSTQISNLFELLRMNISMTMKLDFDCECTSGKFILPMQEKTMDEISPWIHISQTKVSITNKNWLEANQNCQKAKQLFNNLELPMGKIQMNLLECITARKIYSDSFAKIHLRAALEIGQSDNIISVFMIMSEDLSDLIIEIKNEGIINPDYIEKLISVCSAHNQGLLTAKTKQTSVKNNTILTAREFEIAKALVDCKSNKEIAINLNIKEGTVKKLLYNLYQKLEVNSRASAVKKIIEYGIEFFSPS